VFSLGLAS